MVKIFRLNLKTVLLETSEWQHQPIQTHRCHLDAPPYDFNLFGCLEFWENYWNLLGALLWAGTFPILAWHPSDLSSVIIYESSYLGSLWGGRTTHIPMCLNLTDCVVVPHFLWIMLICNNFYFVHTYAPRTVHAAHTHYNFISFNCLMIYGGNNSYWQIRISMSWHIVYSLWARARARTRYKFLN